MLKQAVILSAGLGTRMGTLTKSVPKVMVPIGGKPLLEHHVLQFRKHGVTEFFVNLHYLPDVIRDYFGDGSKWGVSMTYAYEPTILGTAGGAKQFETTLDDAFFLTYGDMFSRVDYTAMYGTFLKKMDAIGMQRMQKTDSYADADVAELDANGRFIAVHPKPHTEAYPNAYRMRGTFILKRDILSYVPVGVPFELGKQLLPEIVRVGKNFYGYECGDYSKGIDTEEKYREVEEYYQAHR